MPYNTQGYHVYPYNTHWVLPRDTMDTHTIPRDTRLGIPSNTSSHKLVWLSSSNREQYIYCLLPSKASHHQLKSRQFTLACLWYLYVGRSTIEIKYWPAVKIKAIFKVLFLSWALYAMMLYFSIRGSQYSNFHSAHFDTVSQQSPVITIIGSSPSQHRLPFLLCLFFPFCLLEGSLQKSPQQKLNYIWR